MSFPQHDSAWVRAADFVRAHYRPGQSILAPDAFIFRVPRLFRYANTRLRPDAAYDWAVVHSWMLQELGDAFLENFDRDMRPVFANAAFVVWSRDPALPRIGRFDPNLRQFRRNRRGQRTGAAAAPQRRNVPPEFDLPDAGELIDFVHLGRAEIKQEMERLYAKGGYHSATPRDAMYTREIDRRTREFMGDPRGLRILDLCCGNSRTAEFALGCAAFVGADLAHEPLRRQAAKWAQRGEYRFAVMAAEGLALPDGFFDIVTFIEGSEHVLDFEGTLREIARVTRPGGRLVVSSQNANSLHLIVNRRLGYPDFFTSYQHLREFTASELTLRLHAQGFAVTQSAGIGFSPYWEIPGVDPIVRHITDDDAEMVEILRKLGERAGAEYAHAFMLSAVKAG